MWETVIGLEVHVELSTRSKIFCACKTAFGAKPNTQCCPVCMGLPGALPTLSEAVLDAAVRTALALHLQIARTTSFDRKNYFYPDLPKGYQISQLYHPIGRNGYLTIETENGEKRIGITEMHMEEDAGKLCHSEETGETYVDFNRCGVPLLEIVSEPDFRNETEVISYLKELRSLCQYLLVSDCKLQEGSMRVDVNLSVRRKGDPVLGTRTETKNLNSFRAVEHAIAHERERQIALLSNGERVLQETRHYNDERQTSYSMRSKEEAMDYRYFPEPDLQPITVTMERIERIASTLPELAREKRVRYERDLQLSAYDAALLTEELSTARAFERLLALVSASNEERARATDAAECAKLVNGSLRGLLSEKGASFETPLPYEEIAYLIRMVLERKLSRAAKMQTLSALLDASLRGEAFSSAAYITEGSLFLVSNKEELRTVVGRVLGVNDGVVAQYRDGKTKVFAFLVGKVMKEMGGSADPEAVRELLREELD